MAGSNTSRGSASSKGSSKHSRRTLASLPQTQDLDARFNRLHKKVYKKPAPDPYANPRWPRDPFEFPSKAIGQRYAYEPPTPVFAYDEMSNSSLASDLRAMRLELLTGKKAGSSSKDSVATPATPLGRTSRGKKLLLDLGKETAEVIASIEAYDSHHKRFPVDLTLGGENPVESSEENTDLKTVARRGTLDSQATNVSFQMSADEHVDLKKKADRILDKYFALLSKQYGKDGKYQWNTDDRIESVFALFAKLYRIYQPAFGTEYLPVIPQKVLEKRVTAQALKPEEVEQAPSHWSQNSDTSYGVYKSFLNDVSQSLPRKSKMSVGYARQKRGRQAMKMISA